MQDMMRAHLHSGTGTGSATQTITTVMTVLLAFAGFEHGLFAALQGNRPTGGVAISAIGEEIRWWRYGGEDALTLVPNFLFSGIAAMSVSLVIVIWALCVLPRRHGVMVLFLLFVLLTAVGGGVGFIPFFIVTCAYASRIGKPLTWWRRRLAPGASTMLAPIWPYALTAVAVCWLLAIAIAIFGYVPGQTDPEIILQICWSFLLLAMVLANVSYIAGFAHDINQSSR